MIKMKKLKCPECGVNEGQLHVLGCDRESCPFCGYAPPVNCGCGVKIIPRNNECLRKDGELKHRIPCLFIPNFCALCGEKEPSFFMVSNEEWEYFVIPELQDTVLCRICWERLLRIFPKGWKEAK